MKKFILLIIIFSSFLSLHALVINEVMSNPIGDDSGREWIEVYNNTENEVDISLLTISIKGGTFVVVTPVSGGTTISARGYAIIGSTVSNTTRFLQDYPTYIGPLFRSSISLVNTGVTSIELKLHGTTAGSLPSYTGAKEGSTYALSNGSFITSTPSPGVENGGETQEEGTPTTTTLSGTQATLPQATPPSADITIYLPLEKVVVAGAPALFSVYSMTHAGKPIDNMVYRWSFGDGGQSTGSTTFYRYFYPGRYATQVEGTNGLIAGTARMLVRVVAPDIVMSSIGYGKYGTYIDITNPSSYDLDISFWKLSLDGALFSFPKNTLLMNGTTRFPSLALGFASTTVSSSTLIKLLFPNMDEVLRLDQGETGSSSKSKLVIEKTSAIPSPKVLRFSSIKKIPDVESSHTVATPTTRVLKSTKKEVRLATFFRSLFGK